MQEPGHCTISLGGALTWKKLCEAGGYDEGAQLRKKGEKTLEGEVSDLISVRIVIGKTLWGPLKKSKKKIGAEGRTSPDGKRGMW